MKKFTKFAAVLLVLCMISAMIPAAFAAGYTAEPAQTVNVTFEVKDILGIDGEISVSDPNGIVDSGKIVKVDTAMTGDFDNAKVYYYSGNLAVSSFVATYEIKLKADAKDGDKCSVTFTYEITDTDYNLSDWKTETHTVVVDIPQPPATVEPTVAPTVKPTEPPVVPPTTSATEPSTVPTVKPTEPVPTTPVVKIDYSKLNEQIGIANGLNGEEYTGESWEKLTAALQAAKNALNSNDQSVVDAASAALEEAIKGLVALDYSALEEAINKVEKFLEDNTVGSKTQELLEALDSAKELLNSKDQTSVDNAAKLLVELLEELEKAISDLTKVEEIIKEIEKIVEVEPSGPYCNISMHYVWPILFFISLLVNIAFVVLTVLYFVRRKKNETDDTPLVDYDIGDDAEGDDTIGGTVE